MTTKNIRGMKKTFSRRPNGKNMYWMLHDHSLDRLKFLRNARKAHAEQGKIFNPEQRKRHNAYYLTTAKFYI